MNSETEIHAYIHTHERDNSEETDLSIRSSSSVLIFRQWAEAGRERGGESANRTEKAAEGEDLELTT